MTENKYVIAKCPKCGRNHVVPTRQKTRECVKCGKRFEVAKATIASFEKASEAREALAASMPATAAFFKAGDHDSFLP